ncbi:MAG: hypothetical protein LBN00_02805 [Oscillospiraceae bacterium]|nr:hypothetical protein [Oscillospiraceae bacterium]
MKKNIAAALLAVFLIISGFPVLNASADDEMRVNAPEIISIIDILPLPEIILDPKEETDALPAPKEPESELDEDDPIFGEDGTVPPHYGDPPIVQPPFFDHGPVPPPLPTPTPEPTPPQLPAAPIPSIDASLASYFTAIDVPEELLGVVKAINIAKLSEGTRDELAAFANASVPHKLTPIMFAMMVEVEDGAASELDLPLLVTFPIPEGADASRFTVITKHDGVLSHINDIKINDDGTFTVALSRFSPFAVAEQTANLVTVTVGDYGNVNPSGAVPLELGEKRTFKFTAQPGFRVGAILLDGEPARLQSDGTLIITGNGRDRSLSVSFTRLQIEPPVTPVPPNRQTPTTPDIPPDATPAIGDIIDIPDYDDSGEPYPPVPQASSPFGAGDTDIIFTPGGDGSAGSDFIPVAVAKGEGWSVLNLFLAIMGPFVPFARFIASPVKRRKAPQPRSSRLLMLFVVAMGIASCALFTLVENLGAPYQIINSNTPLFLVMFIVPTTVFAAIIVRKKNT